MKCLICNQEFERSVSLCNHLFRKHKLTGKEYYDNYIKKENESICKYKDCNNETYFLDINKGYKECCCLEHTNLYRYGVKSNLNFEETKAKAQKNSHTKEANTKGLQTRIDRYGGSGFSSPEIKEKIISTVQDKYQVDNVFQAELVKQKCRETKLKNHGNPNYNNREKFKITIRNKILNGQYRTIYEELFMTLSNKNSIIVIPEYDSDVYPYLCDFYIPDKDCYVEVNIHWSHGKHWFNSSSVEDIKTKEVWLSKKSKSYNNSIVVWTQSDVEKRNTAKENRLNYVVLWSKQDIIDWFNDNCPIRQDWY